MERENTLESKFCGALLGAALGDAVGEIAFSRPTRAGLLDQVRSSRLLRYTDDTAMLIGLAQSLVRDGAVNSRELGDTFRANFLREPWRGYASGPPTVFSLVANRSLSYVQAAGRLFGGTGSFGNGAAMRVAPVGLFFFDALDLYEQARLASTVTHSHPVGVDGAAVLAKASAQALLLQPRESFHYEAFLSGLLSFARTDIIREKLKEVGRLLEENAVPEQASGALGRGVAVQDSLPFAIYSFLRHPQSFERCLCCAVLNGGDRDTLGAMACAVSGAYLGEQALIRSWLEKLENRTLIRELAVGLLAARDRRH
jgi:poly(ADP-ribose) glycohydrolase ARH3